MKRPYLPQAARGRYRETTQYHLRQIGKQTRTLGRALAQIPPWSWLVQLVDWMNRNPKPYGVKVVELKKPIGQAIEDAGLKLVPFKDFVGASVVSDPPNQDCTIKPQTVYMAMNDCVHCCHGIYAYELFGVFATRDLAEAEVVRQYNKLASRGGGWHYPVNGYLDISHYDREEWRVDEHEVRTEI